MEKEKDKEEKYIEISLGNGRNINFQDKGTLTELVFNPSKINILSFKYQTSKDFRIRVGVQVINVDRY